MTLAARTVLAFTAFDIGFKSLVVPAYAGAAGKPLAEVLPSAAAVAIVTTGIFLAVAYCCTHPVDRWARAEIPSESNLHDAGARLRRLPRAIAVAWTVEWVVLVVLLAALWTEEVSINGLKAVPEISATTRLLLRA